jgi:hypothetical protein
MSSVTTTPPAPQVEPLQALLGPTQAVTASPDTTQQAAPIEPDQVLSLPPKRYPYVVTLNASEHTGRGVTLVSTTDDFIRGLSGTTAERFRPAFRPDP